MPGPIPRTMWTMLEPIHGFIYFVDEAAHRYAELGLERVAHYFASRSAAMGAAEHGVVTASFYSFSPGLVRRAMRDAWSTTTPARVLAARYEAVDEVLSRAWAHAEPDAIAEAADLAMEAASACRPEGRPLYAGHASLGVPASPHVRLWHALTLLREHRGDGHSIALQASGFGPLDALLTSAGFSVLTIPQLEAMRGWRRPEWETAREQLVQRGWLTGDGDRTVEGTAARLGMEELTDRLAAAPWEHLGPRRTERLGQLLVPLRAAILASTDLPRRY